MADYVPPPILEILRTQVKRGEQILGDRGRDTSAGQLTVVSGVVRAQLAKILGNDSAVLLEFTTGAIQPPAAAVELAQRIERVRGIVSMLEALSKGAKSTSFGKKIFMGHGRSHVWLQLKDFIREQLKLPCDEFNVEPAAGLTTTERLETMLEEAGLAFIVMTAEEKHEIGVFARPNVIHESGLFQGKLGTKRAIVLLEQGCSDFSNIAGLTQIRFPKDDIKPVFEEIRRVLAREGF